MQAVVSLDVLAAKVRYGLWTRGVLPSFVAWSAIFHQRGEKAALRRARARPSSSNGASGNGWSGAAERDGAAGTSSGEDEDDEGGARYAVRLRALRHPLLLGDFLKERGRLERELRRLGVDPTQLAAAAAAAAGGEAPGGSLGGVGAGRANGLSARREGLLREYGLDSAPPPPVAAAQGGRARGRRKGAGAAGDEGGVQQLLVSPPPHSPFQTAIRARGTSLVSLVRC